MNGTPIMSMLRPYWAQSSFCWAISSNSQSRRGSPSLTGGQPQQWSTPWRLKNWSISGVVLGRWVPTCIFRGFRIALASVGEAPGGPQAASAEIAVKLLEVVRKCRRSM